MRIGILLSDQPSSVGGGFTFEQEVFDRLIALAPESRHHFVVLHANAKRADAPANVEFPMTLPRPLARVAGASRRLWLERTAKAFEIDLLWSITPFHPVTDTPYITISWDLQHRLQPFFPEVSANGEWEARERQHASRLRRAARIIVGTETGKAELVRFYQVPDDRVCVLPHPTPRFALDAPAADDRATVERLGIRGDYLLYPAQFWPHKNHANLLLALRELPELSLVLVGSDRGNGDHVRRMIDELGLASRTHVVGFVPIAELVALYRHAFALAYVSLFGPDNLPPLEAFALGCPVVAADVASEQLGDAAITVDATRPEAIAAAVRSLEDPARRAQLIERGHARARSFTGDDFVRGVFAQIDELVPYLRCWRPDR